MKIGDRCPEVATFKENVSWEVNTFKKFIAPQRTYDLWTALKDITVVGAIHSMGKDQTHLNLFHKKMEWMRVTSPQINRELMQHGDEKLIRSVNDLRNLAQKTLISQFGNAFLGFASKAAYVSSVAVAGVGLFLDAVPLVVLGGVGGVAAVGYFAANAAYKSGDLPVPQSTFKLFDNLLNRLGEQLNQEIAVENAEPVKVQPETTASEPTTAPAA